MSNISSYETVKSPQKSKEKSLQELHDRYLRKGDEAIIAEDIISAEKYYQHADHYLRLMNDPHPVHPSTPPRSMEELIAKALKGIKAEREARKEALLKQVRGVAKASATVRKKKKEAARQKQILEAKMAGSKKKAGKKARNSDEPCKIIPLNSKAPRVELEKKN
jgi:hypothetical protein